jgi:pimeloyl-ACP methyl ester carboxylesterase
MTNYSHETAPTQFVETQGIRYAYRRFGKPGAVPLLFLEYFNSNMDGWDPAVTNGLATDHEVILFDNAGVAASGGETTNTVMEMTPHCVAFCRALGLEAINIVGFSLGGMIAQQLALDHPDLVRRLILLGTAPRGGEGLTFTELSSEEQTDPVAFLLGAFFSPSEASQEAGREYLKRLESRKEDVTFLCRETQSWHSWLRSENGEEVLQLWRGDLISWTNAPRTLSRRSVQMAPI